MKTNITQVCAAAIGTMLLAGLATKSNAQVSITAGSLNYTQDFNTLESATGSTFTTLPNGWAIAELGSNANGQYRTGDGSVNNGDTYSFGTNSATERGIGGVASNGLQATFGVKFVNNSGAAITGLNISFKGEQWRVGGNTSPDTLSFAYSTVAAAVSDTVSANWTNVVALNFNSLVSSTTAGALDGNAAANSTTKTGTISVNIPVGGSIILKWRDINIAGNDDGLGIDDLNVTFTTGSAPVTTHIVLQNKVPAHGATNVALSTNRLAMVFDSTVAAGTGNIKLVKTGGATQTFTVPSAAVTFVEDSVIVTGITLENNSDYHVEYDSTVATNLSGTMRSLGIYNATSWVFSTEDTVTPPPPTPLTSLDEKFMNCINTEMGVFVEYSEQGTATWRCSRFGRNKPTSGADSFAVYINGGTGAGVSTNNKDWLISKAPFDFSAMANPTLSFWQTRRFSGTATRKLMVSTDYVAGENPANATWTEVNVPGLATAPAEDTWTQISNVNLTAYKSTPFYLAFTYECGTTGTYELAYDDIKVENATSIKTVNGATVGIQVLGEPTTNQINLNVEVKANENIELQLFDLLGRKVATQKATVQAGANRLSFTSLNLNAGMYVIRVISENGFGTVKAVVK
ncbi:MAG: T9SS type A sorting domain-containing protein [Taibaiella sp.]|nr:T9SS type A sorting domain-containing protein [Taibaiella sp.]